MNVVFRTDASSSIGTGHVSRCTNLARSLATSGAEIRFLCRRGPGDLIDQIEREFAVTAFSDDEEPDIPGADWLVVDHYGLGIEYETRMRPHAGRVLVIDDWPDRPHACDVLLDQNFAAADRLAQRLIPQNCQPLIGPRFALLAPGYAQHRQGRTRDGSVRRVLVYFGGVDAANMTSRAIEALAAPQLSHLDVDVVVGPNHPAPHQVDRDAAERGRVTVHRSRRPHLADLMQAADLAVGAGGVTLWERFCVGLPALIVSIAENQRATCEALAAAGLIAYAGDASQTDAATLSRLLGDLVDDRERLSDLSVRGAAVVDGRGAERVAEVMTASSDAIVAERHALHRSGARPEDFEGFTFRWIDRCRAGDVLALRNAPQVRSQMRSSGAIGRDHHQAFLDGYGDADRYDFVLVDTATGRAIGTFYVTGLRSVPELGKYIGDPAFEGRGIARTATGRLLDFCRARTRLRRLIAVTRADNTRNIALNTSLGFTRVGRHDGYVVMTLEL